MEHEHGGPLFDSTRLSSTLQWPVSGMGVLYRDISERAKGVVFLHLPAFFIEPTYPHVFPWRS